MADRNCPSTKWWHLAKSLCGLGNIGSPTVAPLLNQSQSTVFDDRAKADLLNDTFVNQNNSLNPRGFPYGPTHLKSVFRLKHIPASDVKKAIQRLPNKMSTGSDLISYRLLKVARNEVENASFAQRSAHRDSRIWRPELIEPAAERKRRARGRRPTFKSAYPDPQILLQCNISSNYPL